MKKTKMFYYYWNGIENFSITWASITKTSAKYTDLGFQTPLHDFITHILFCHLLVCLLLLTLSYRNYFPHVALVLPQSSNQQSGTISSLSALLSPTGSCLPHYVIRMRQVWVSPIPHCHPYHHFQFTTMMWIVWLTNCLLPHVFMCHHHFPIGSCKSHHQYSLPSRCTLYPRVNLFIVSKGLESLSLWIPTITLIHLSLHWRDSQVTHSDMVKSRDEVPLECQRDSLLCYVNMFPSLQWNAYQDVKGTSH